MKPTNIGSMNTLQTALQRRDITMVYQTDPLTSMTHVRLQKGERTIYHTFSDYEDVNMRVKEMVKELDEDTRSELDLMRGELNKYKAAVKKLSFDLEMASTSSRAVATEADVRKKTLEMAAEFLMDYGIIKTGTELESVCEQMKRLHPSRAAVMAEAAKKMSAGWTQYDPK